MADHGTMLDVTELLQAIRSAQDDDQSFDTAFGEISNGQKTGHWIWWVWPSLRHVRTTSLPHFSLPSFAASVAYLSDPVLCERLSRITRIATAHLATGVPPSTLFGSETDAAKFYETTTLFAVAATFAGQPVEALVHTAAVAAVEPSGALHPGTMAAIKAETGTDFGGSVTQLVQLGQPTTPPPRPIRPPTPADSLAAAAAAAAAALRTVKESGGFLHVMTGAGMSVSSGVPVFRNADGSMSAEFLKFLGDYNAARRKAGLAEAADWFDFSVPHMFDKATEREAWAYWRWRALRAMVEPAEDYRLLSTLIEYFGRDRSFVTTSNCDMLHVLSGTSDQAVHEIHGSLGRTQCSASCCETMYPVDPAFLARLRDEADWVPRCPACHSACLRPNVMIFGDYQFVTAELDAQERRSKAFGERSGGVLGNQVVLEIGGGVVVPSIRIMAEYAATTGQGLVRINPSETECAKTQCDHTERWLREEYFPLVSKSDAGLRALCRELGLATP